MFRGLIILAALVIIYLLVKRLIGSKLATQNKTPSPSKNMLQCAECGTFIPKNEAIIESEQSFCCKQHQQDWQLKNQGK